MGNNVQVVVTARRIALPVHNAEPMSLIVTRVADIPALGNVHPGLAVIMDLLQDLALLVKYVADPKGGGTHLQIVRM